MKNIEKLSTVDDIRISLVYTYTRWIRSYLSVYSIYETLYHVAVHVIRHTRITYIYIYLRTHNMKRTFRSGANKNTKYLTRNPKRMHISHRRVDTWCQIICNVFFVRLLFASIVIFSIIFVHQHHYKSFGGAKMKEKQQGWGGSDCVARDFIRSVMVV